MEDVMIYGALEAGGTKMVCALGDGDGNILEKISIPTSTPEDTLPRITDFFKERDIAALGIACFGPIDLIKDSGTYGHILMTPKTAWRDCDILGILREALGVPCGFDTDVNGSLLGEVTYGSAKGLTDVIYLTIGTGIGAGIMAGGRLLHGMLHPEAGHILMRPVKGDDYKGRCPSHCSCFEGMASGPAIEERWGAPGRELADRSEVWELEADYIAQALTDYIMVLSPQRIILGGGVMHQEQLFSMIREKTAAYINGYLRTRELDDMDSYIVPASLGDDQGILGAIRLAVMA